MCSIHYCSECCIVLTLYTGLSNWSWNMCAMVNWPTLIENNIYSCTSSSVWTIFPNRIRKSHQVVLGFITGLFKISVTGASFRSEKYFRPKVLLSLIYINKYTNPSKFTLPGFSENFANLCTAKLKSTLVENRQINNPMQAM